MKGIPFSPEMALALREGRKSETRRVVKEAKYSSNWEFEEWESGAARLQWLGALRAEQEPELRHQRFKPKYNVGDVCFVQEAWAKVPRTAFWHDQSIPHVEYIDETGFAWWSVFKDDWDRSPLSWKSPRFMPAWAARTFVEITSVRVERVRDISIHAALLEGLRCPDCGYTSIDAGFHMDHGICVNSWLKRAKAGSEEDHSLIASFRELWNRLHPKAPYRFEDDPWVWVHGLKEVPRP